MESSHTSPDSQNCCIGIAAWKFPLLLVVVLGGILLWNREKSTPQSPAPEAASTDWLPTARPTGETVALEIDFGNGARRVFAALPYQADMTVADVMDQACRFRPAISFTQVGQGARGLLIELEGLKNEVASGRNWQYEVAGTPGNKSFCLQTVAPGELVRWTFAGAD
jgi:hypothetical protein